jgi:hypothetical protein
MTHVSKPRPRRRSSRSALPLAKIENRSELARSLVVTIGMQASERDLIVWETPKRLLKGCIHASLNALFDHGIARCRTDQDPAAIVCLDARLQLPSLP